MNPIRMIELQIHRRNVLVIRKFGVQYVTNLPTVRGW